MPSEKYGPQPPAAEIWDEVDQIRKRQAGQDEVAEAERALERARQDEYPIKRPSGDRAKGYRKVG